MSFKHEHWAITKVWQNRVKNKWQTDPTVVRGMVLAMQTHTVKESTFESAARHFASLTKKEQQDKHAEDKQWIHGSLTTIQGKILYLDDIWDIPYPHPFHGDEDFESKGMLWNVLLIHCTIY